MPQFLLVGLAAGMASALLFASASAGGMGGRMLLFYLAPLPTYLAGLGWGAIAAAIAAVVSALGAGLFLAPATGGIYFLGHGLPAIVLCHLALLHRPLASPTATYPATPPSAPAIEWYPPGRLVAAATWMAGLLAMVTVLLVGTDLDDVRKAMREFLDQVVLKQIPPSGTTQLDEKQLTAFTEIMLYALPAGAAVFWLSSFLLNLWLAARVTLISGRLTRPWPELALMRFPARFGLALAAAFAATALIQGYLGLIAAGFAGAFIFAYVIMGLAIVHYATRNNPARMMILAGVYLALLILNTWAALVVALIGILEPLLPWRRPPDAPTPPPPPPSPGT
ncbi:MAG: DUF2232 domain-containing protein [Hyphomicrobiaceae bacterium]